MLRNTVLPICLLVSSSALVLHPTAPCRPVAKPLLPSRRFHAARLQTTDAVVPVEPVEPEKPATMQAKVKAMLPPANEMKKLVPLATMFFCILFSYTILRDTKDVLVVTAPGGSAEVIPFLKTYVNLPGAIAFTVAYSAAANRLGSQALFYCTLTPFLAFFGSFAAFIYPMRHALHPNGFADFLTTALPAGFSAPIGVLRNWTYSLFYLLANMWGSVVVSLMFWGFACAQDAPNPAGLSDSFGRSATHRTRARASLPPLPVQQRDHDRLRGQEVLPPLRHVRQRRARLLRPVCAVRLADEVEAAGWRRPVGRGPQVPDERRRRVGPHRDGLLPLPQQGGAAGRELR